VSYLIDYAEEFPDPLEKIQAVLEDGRKLSGKEWEVRRDEVAAQVGKLVGGLKKETVARTKESVAAFLDQAHDLKEDAFQAQKPALQQTALTLVGSGGPTEVIRNFVELMVAELLSNPRLAAAVEARLKKK
jgi:hypothetical protein